MRHKHKPEMHPPGTRLAMNTIEALDIVLRLAMDAYNREAQNDGIQTAIEIVEAIRNGYAVSGRAPHVMRETLVEDDL